MGVDPVLKGREEELSDGKITAIGDFLENIDLGRYMDSESTLILSNHSLEHLENPRATIERLLAVSTDKTLFIFEFPGFDSLINDCRFDQVFHHHLHYFSLHSFVYLLNELGCELISHEVDPHYWGSLLVAFRKTSKKEINQLQSAEKFGSERILKNYDLFKQKMDITNRYIESFRKEKLFGYGAGLQLPVLGYHLNNDFSYFNCIIDDDKDKEGLFYLNLPVSIKNSTGLDNLEEAIVVITAVNFSRNILPKVIGFKPKRIILPFSNI